MPCRPRNDFATLNRIEVGGILLDYYGQVNTAAGQMPDGIGIAVDKEGEIIEGGFTNGNFGNLYRQIYSLYDSTDHRIHYITSDGREYNVKLV